MLLEICKDPPNNFKEQGLLLELWFKERVFLKFQGSSRSPQGVLKVSLGALWASFWPLISSQDAPQRFPMIPPGALQLQKVVLIKVNFHEQFGFVRVRVYTFIRIYI